MSALRTDLKTLPEDLIPYLQEVFLTFSKSRNIGKMYLVGSRGRLPFEKWEKLRFKDWDVALECDHDIPDAYKLGRNNGYHLDLVITTHEGVEAIRNNNYRGISRGFEIFPETPEFLKKFLK